MRKPDFNIYIIVAGLVLAGGTAPVPAQEVGKYAVVQNEVSSLLPGSSEAIQATIGAPIVLKASETTGAASRAKFLFGEGAVISIGQKTTFNVSQQAVDEATGKASSSVDVAEGKLRVFVSRFWGGRPEVNVNTPTAVVGIKGSEVLIDVTDGRTTVTVFGGSAEVRTKSGGPATTLSVAQQVEVSSTGGMGSPVVVDAAVLTGLWQSTEPTPDPPIEPPSNPPVAPPPNVQARTNLAATDCVTCGGTTAISDPVNRGTRDVTIGPGQPINSGTKAGGR